jgi:hypothetical protein
LYRNWDQPTARSEEGVDHLQVAEPLAVLKILRIEKGAAGAAGGADEKRIPERGLMGGMQIDRSQDVFLSDHYQTHLREDLDLPASCIHRDPELPGGGELPPFMDLVPIELPPPGVSLSGEPSKLGHLLVDLPGRQAVKEVEDELIDTRAQSLGHLASFRGKVVVDGEMQGHRKSP